MLFNNAGAKHLKHYWNRLKVKADDLFDQVGSDSSRPDPYSAAAWQRGFTSSHHLFISPPLPLLPPSHPAFSSYLLFRPLCSGDILFFFLSFFLKNSSHHRLLCSEAHLPSPSFYLEGKMTFRPREAFLTKEVPSILFPSLKPQALLPPFSVLVLYICMYGEQLRRWLVGGRMSLIQRQAEIHNLWRGKKILSALLGKLCKS